MVVVQGKKYPLPFAGTDLVKVQARRGLGLVGPLLQVIDGKGWVAGGFARWCCSPNENPAPTADLDVFFGSDEDYFAVVEALTLMGAHATRTMPYLTQMNVERAFPGVGLPEVQLIKPFIDGVRHWGPAKEDVVRQIDLSVCRIALDGSGYATATADQQFLADETDRRVRFVRINYAPAVIRHAFKYAVKGYKITDSESIKLLESWVASKKSECQDGCETPADDRKPQRDAQHDGREDDRDANEGY